MKLRIAGIFSILAFLSLLVTGCPSSNTPAAPGSTPTATPIPNGGVVTTLAGSAGVTGATNATGTSATFNNPAGVAVDSSGNVYVADVNNHLIRKITSGGVVTTLAGSAGVTGATNATGTFATFNNPNGVAVDSSGNVYVADTFNHLIRKITPGGVVSTLAGTGSSGSNNATGTSASFSYPYGVAVDSSGNVYVGDTYNYLIRKITPGGVVTTLAGTVGSFGAVNATGTSASFYFPAGVAVDSSGNVYVADENNHLIRKITSGGVVTTLAGTAGSFGAVNATGTSASFYYPTGVAVDNYGTVYVADHTNYLIRQITPGGVVTTLAGLAGSPGSNNATGTSATFNVPNGIAVDSSRIVYVGDAGNHLVRKIQ